MKTLCLLFLLGTLVFFSGVESYGNSTVPGTGSHPGTPRTKDLQCTVFQRGHVPLSWMLEDVVAYALDIPFAMASPLISLIPSPEEETGPCGNGASQRNKRK